MANKIPMIYNSMIKYAQDLDQKDPLAKYKKKFEIDDPELLYFDGNSLGRLPKKTQQRLHSLIQNEWGKNLIRSWNDSWITLASRVGKKIANLIDADKNEVIIADSTSINLFKLAFAALHLKSDRTKIISDNLNFPSDIYILEKVASLFGSNYYLKIVDSPDGLTMPIERIAAEVDKTTALVSLSHTVFKSGFVYNLDDITELAHKAGAFMLWDLSHSVGAVDVSMTSSNSDLAVGCTYKYLNGGPGSPAFIFVRKDLQKRLENPISGWFSQTDPFVFDLTHKPVQGIQRFLTGTPPILSLAAIEDGVDLLLEAGMANLRKKSMAQTSFLVDLWKSLLLPCGFRLNSPQNPIQRGSHISLGHDDGYRINRALIEDKKVIPDFRMPDNIRFGIAPIYTSFMDIYSAMTRLKQIMDEQMYEKYPFEKETVT